MNTALVLLVACGACGLWYVVTSIRIYEDLRRRNIPVSFLWLRVMIPKYAHQYKVITRRESGKVGPLFTHWIVSINLALILALVGFGIKAF